MPATGRQKMSQKTFRLGLDMARKNKEIKSAMLKRRIEKYVYTY